MSKGSIKDPSITIRAGTKLLEYIEALADSDLELPENVAKLHATLTGDKSKRKIFESNIPTAALTKRDKLFLETLSTDDKVCNSVQKCLQQLSLNFEAEEESEAEEIADVEDADLKNVSKAEAKRRRAKARDQEVARITLSLNDLKWLNMLLSKRRDAGESSEYLHELLVGSQLILPRNAVIERNPELEARCARLRREQENQTYQAMTKNVDNNRRMAPDDTIGSQSKRYLQAFQDKYFLKTNDFFLFCSQTN